MLQRSGVQTPTSTQGRDNAASSKEVERYRRALEKMEEQWESATR